MCIRRMVVILAAMVAMSGCTAPQMKNADHPTYGDAEYQRDRGACEDANSHLQTGTGYAEAVHKVVDEDGVKACLASRGWH